MAKKLPSPAEMKAAVEAFKKQFTTGFYHGSPSPNIKEFDPTKSSKDPMYTTPKATFVTRDPEFAESFLSMNNSGKVKSGSTMYPVSVNLGQHWNPGTPEGQEVIQEFIAQYPKRVNLEKGLKRGDWTAIENSDFLEHLKNTGHDTFHVVEGGIPNVGVLKPENIRGKFAEYNPEEAANPDFMKAEGGAVEGYAPGGKVTAVKKMLEHARSVPFVHFSNKSDLMHLDPNMYGTGIKGQEAARLKSAPDIRPRSYIYTDRPDVRPEQGLGSHKYSGVAEDMYPLHEDPAGYSSIAKMKAIDPYMMSMGREVIDQPTHLNELERLIKAAGYKGYANDDVGLLFHPTDVKKVGSPEQYADGGSVGTTSLPANYQQARSAFDQQQTTNPMGGASLAVTGNDQFGQQFGYAADADAFNTFYNQNYSSPATPMPIQGMTLPVSLPSPPDPNQPYMPIMGNPSTPTAGGGLTGMLAGNTPAAPTTAPAYKPMPNTLAEYQAQRGNGPVAAVLDPWAGTTDANGTWVRNPDQNAAYAAYAAQQNAANGPQPVGGLAGNNPVAPPPPPIPQNSGNVTPQLPPSSPVAAATAPTTPQLPPRSPVAAATPGITGTSYMNLKTPRAAPSVLNQFGTRLNQVRQGGEATPQTQVNTRGGLLPNLARFRKR